MSVAGISRFFLYQENDSLLTDKPILSKVGDLGDRYWTWIHQPYEGTFRLFESDVLENMTRTSWWVVPLVWLPLVILFTVRAFSLVFQNYGELIRGWTSLTFYRRRLINNCIESLVLFRYIWANIRPPPPLITLWKTETIVWGPSDCTFASTIYPLRELLMVLFFQNCLRSKLKAVEAVGKPGSINEL